MTTQIDNERRKETEFRIFESRKHLQELYASACEIKHLSSGSGGDVFVSGEGDDRVVYKVRRIDSQARPDYWVKEALVMHLLFKKGMAPRLVGFLSDTTNGSRQVVQRRLEIDKHTIQVLRSQLDEESLRTFEEACESCEEKRPVDTGIIRMEYVANDPEAFHRLQKLEPEEIDHQIKEIADFLRSQELYPSDVELVFDGKDNRLKFRDVGGFRVCRAKNGDWEETEEMSGTVEERLRELLTGLERIN